RHTRWPRDWSSDVCSSDLIRSQILNGSGLHPLPEKCPLNPIIGNKRIFDGYQVTNVAFESLPGVYVTGSLYSPVNAKGSMPGVRSEERRVGKECRSRWQTG